MTVAADALPAVEQRPFARLDSRLSRAFVGISTLAMCLAGAALAAGPLDLDLFATAGRAMLRGDLGAVYANPDVQAGPLQLLIAAGLAVGGAVNVPVLAVRLVTTLAVAAVVGWLLHRSAPVHPARRAALGLGVGLWFLGGGAWGGHPAELLIPLTWVGAAAAVRRGRWVVAGLAVAAATAVAPWGVLGAPVLLGAGARAGLRAVLVAGFGGLAAYLPFVLTGRFAMLEHTWPVASGTLVHLLAPGAQHFGWAARLAQGAVVLVGCLLVARVSGHHGVVLVPLTAVVLRLVSDPVDLTYYWVPIGVLTLALLLTGRRDEAPARHLLVVAYVPWLAYAAAVGPVWVALALVVAVPLLVPIAVRHAIAPVAGVR